MLVYFNSTLNFEIYHISARNNFKQHRGSKFNFYSPVRLTAVRDLKNLPVSAQHLVFNDKGVNFVKEKKEKKGREEKRGT